MMLYSTTVTTCRYPHMKGLLDYRRTLKYCLNNWQFAEDKALKKEEVDPRMMSSGPCHDRNI